MAEIHRLTDAGPIIEPDPELVRILAELLEQAQAGSLKGFGVFYVDGADTVWSQIAGGCARSNDMVAGVAALYDEVITTWRHS